MLGKLMVACVRVDLLSVSKFNLQKQLDDFIYLRHRTTESQESNGFRVVLP